MSFQEITPEELRRWLAAGRPVTVLDVRPEAQREEWSIPNSRHEDVYDRLWESDPTVLQGIDLPRDRPIVAVCNAGKTSALAADRLAAQGFEALSMVGGMKAWSLAWNEAVMDFPATSAAPAVRVVQVRRTGKGCLSYMVGAGVGNAAEAVIIDASCEPDVYLEIARREGWRISAIVDTHIHADHLCRSRALARATGAPDHLPATDRARYPVAFLADGDTIAFGGAQLTVMATPGHTPESVSYRLDDRVLFSGDTLFTPGVGRPDLEASPEGARARAGLLFRSLHRILELPSTIRVMGGHTSRPIAFDGVPVAMPLSEARAAVDRLPREESLFVAEIVGRLPATPPNHHAIVKHNEDGTFPEGSPIELEAGANRCAVSG